jgi:hypothetical protein
MLMMVFGGFVLGFVIASAIAVALWIRASKEIRW